MDVHCYSLSLSPTRSFWNFQVTMHLVSGLSEGDDVSLKCYQKVWTIQKFKTHFGWVFSICQSRTVEWRFPSPSPISLSSERNKFKELQAAQAIQPCALLSKLCWESRLPLCNQQGQIRGSAGRTEAEFSILNSLATIIGASTFAETFVPSIKKVGSYLSRVLGPARVFHFASRSLILCSVHSACAVGLEEQVQILTLPLSVKVTLDLN